MDEECIRNGEKNEKRLIEKMKENMLSNEN
jgi:hypothetical protein